MGSKIWLETTEPANFKVGGNQVQKIMVGTTQVWPEEVDLIEFNMSGIGFDFSSVCRQSAAVPRYHSGTGSEPTIGDFVYTDSGGTTPVNGGIQYFKIDGGWIQIDANGQVTAEGACTTQIEITASSYNDSFSACQSSTGLVLRYTNSSQILPGIGDTIFTDEQRTIPYNGNDRWFKTEGNSAILIGTDGVITSAILCV